MIVELSDELEQSDSGMESLTASKDDTPERKPDDNFLSSAPVRNLSLCYVKFILIKIIKTLFYLQISPSSCLKDLSVKEFDDVSTYL